MPHTDFALYDHTLFHSRRALKIVCCTIRKACFAKIARKVVWRRWAREHIKPWNLLSTDITQANLFINPYNPSLFFSIRILSEISEIETALAKISSQLILKIWPLLVAPLFLPARSCLSKRVHQWRCTELTQLTHTPLIASKLLCRVPRSFVNGLNFSYSTCKSSAAPQPVIISLSSPREAESWLWRALESC